MSGGLSRLVPSSTQPPPIPSPASGGGLGWGLSAAKRVSVIGRLGLCVLVLSVALVGCGKRNAPTAPPDQPDTYPRPYPSE
jgi:hypothetical protein